MAFCNLLKHVASQLYTINAFSEAEAVWRQCVTVFRELLAKDPLAASNRELLAHALHNQATCLVAVDRYRDAVGVSSEAAELRRGLFALDQLMTKYGHGEGRFLQRL